MNRAFALILAIFIGVLAVVIPTVLQPRFAEGSLPDLICSVILAPGSFVADLFIHRGATESMRDPAKPEFLLLARVVTFILFGGVAYGVLSIKKPTI
jgi:hypothetical protein